MGWREPTTVLAEVRWQNASHASLSSLREANHLLLVLDFSEEWLHPPPPTYGRSVLQTHRAPECKGRKNTFLLVLGEGFSISEMRLTSSFHSTKTTAPLQRSAPPCSSSSVCCNCIYLSICWFYRYIEICSDQILVYRGVLESSSSKSLSTTKQHLETELLHHTDWSKMSQQV